MQASMRPHRVTVTLGRQSLSCNQPFASVTPYRSVRAGTWTVHVVGADERATAQVTLAAGTKTTLVVLDGRGRLALSAPAAGVDTEKPAASAVARKGNRAPKPGGSPVPWLLLGGAGLVLGLAGAVRLRQIRWARRVAAYIR
jgi:hypothetical protein